MNNVGLIQQRTTECTNGKDYGLHGGDRVTGCEDLVQDGTRAKPHRNGKKRDPSSGGTMDGGSEYGVGVRF